MIGISHAYGGALSALSVEYTLTPFWSNGRKIWSEKEVVTAIYEDWNDVLVDESRTTLGDP